MSLVEVTHDIFMTIKLTVDGEHPGRCESGRGVRGFVTKLKMCTLILILRSCFESEETPQTRQTPHFSKGIRLLSVFPDTAVKNMLTSEVKCT